MAKLNYPFDDTGVASSNRIVDELKSVQPPTDITEASFFVPRAAPFFSTSVEIYTAPEGKGTKLIEGTDYFFVYKFVAGTNITGRPLAGGICFTNALYTGNVYITYQTLGGDFTVSDLSLLEQIARRQYADVRFVRWDHLEGVPSAFPPDAHKHKATEDCTLDDIKSSLELIAAAISASTSDSDSSGTNLIRAHIGAVSGAHTPGAVGLGNVPNYPVATENDAVNRRSDRLMTPSVTAFLIRRYLNELNLGTFEDDIGNLAQRVTALESAVRQLTSIVMAIAAAVEELNNNLNIYRSEIANLSRELGEVQESVQTTQVLASQALAQAAAATANVEQVLSETNEVLYTGGIVLSEGEHLITIAAGQSTLISASGGGGGSGKWFQSSALISQLGAFVGDGFDTVIYYLGSRSNPIPPLPILISGGGCAGSNAYAEIGATSGGQGGKCLRIGTGRVKASDLPKVDISTAYVQGPVDTNGVNGRSGDTGTTATTVDGVGGWGVATGGMAITRVYGKGADGVSRASTGGSGGRWETTLQNDLKEPVRIIVRVGMGGMSARAVMNERNKNVTGTTTTHGVATLTIVA